MEQVIEKIWSYGILSDEEKSELEAYVSTNTEYASVLKEAKEMHVLLEQAGLFASDSSDEIALAYLVANNQVIPGSPPSVLQRAYEQLQNKIKTMPQAQESYSRMRGRMEQIAMSNDPVSQFEQLTGYSIDRDFEDRKADRVYSKRKFAKDRRSIAGNNQVRFKRRAIRFNLVLAGCLVVLFVGYFENRIARNAYSSANMLLVDEIIEERGLDEYAQPVSPDVLFTFAQRTLFEAQHRWLGIYYTYDEVKLAEAEELLNSVRQDSSSSPFLQEESIYLLAKIAMASKDYSKTTALLDELVALRGRRLEEAQRLRSLVQD